MPFRRDAVLQENVILFGIRQDRWHENEVDASLTISSSLGVDDIGEPGLPRDFSKGGARSGIGGQGSPATGLPMKMKQRWPWWTRGRAASVGWG